MNLEFQHFIETNKINGRYFLKKKYLLHNILCKIAHPYRIWDWVEHILFCCFHVFIVFSNFSCVSQHSTKRFIYYKEHSNMQEQKSKGKKQPQKNPNLPKKNCSHKKGGKTKMEEITYKGESGIFMTHKERNNLFSLIKKQSNLVKQALQKSEETIRECKNELDKRNR